MLVSDRYTCQEPVLPDWSAPAMGAAPKANQPLFGIGEYLATEKGTNNHATVK
jgi:hypothetical protein